MQAEGLQHNMDHGTSYQVKLMLAVHFLNVYNRVKNLFILYVMCVRPNPATSIQIQEFILPYFVIPSGGRCGEYICNTFKENIFVIPSRGRCGEYICNTFKGKIEK